MNRSVGHGSVMTREPPVQRGESSTADYELSTGATGHIDDEPATVVSQGRLYTTRRQRESLGVDNGDAGRGEAVEVVISVVDRCGEWVHVDTAAFHATLVTDGAIRIPIEIRRELGLEYGDHVRLTINNST